MLAGFCSTRNFDLGMARHANGRGGSEALRRPLATTGGLGRQRGVSSSRGNRGGNKAAFGLAWQNSVS